MSCTQVLVLSIKARMCFGSIRRGKEKKKTYLPRCRVPLTVAYRRGPAETRFNGVIAAVVGPPTEKKPIAAPNPEFGNGRPELAMSVINGIEQERV